MDVRKMLNEAKRARLDTIHDYSRVHTGASGAFDAGNRAEEEFISDAIAAEVARAVAEEREACALVAHQMFQPCKSHAAGECPNPPQKWTAGTAIAAAIRARGTKKEER